MAINFTGDNAALKEKILRVLQANEIGQVTDPSVLSRAPGATSGWTFGDVQFDLASNNTIGLNAFLRILLEATDSQGNFLIHDDDPTTGRGTITAVEDKKVLDLYNKAIKKTNALNAQEIDLINAALKSSRGKEITDQAVDAQINFLINYANNIINNAPAGDQAFLRTDLGYLWLIDLRNQGTFGISAFLNGGDINGYTKQGDFTFDDLVNVYFRQRQLLISPQNNKRKVQPWDPFRRLANVVKEAGGYTLNNLDEAKSILRAYTYLYVRYENELLQTSGRRQAVNDFRQYVCKPANDMIFANWQSVGGSMPITYDDILMGDDRNNNSTTGDYILNGRDGNDVIFGEGGNDYIEGGAGNDTLIGGIGNDTLVGGIGDDTLIGGENDDTYIINVGDGNDTIEDKDDDNTVILCGKELKFFYNTGDDETYISSDGTLELKKSTGKLTDADNHIVVTLNENFEDGDFGITLITLPTDPDTTNSILGDLTPKDFENLRRAA